jgi:hypothetical protein
MLKPLGAPENQVPPYDEQLRLLYEAFLKKGKEGGRILVESTNAREGDGSHGELYRTGINASRSTPLQGELHITYLNRGVVRRG